MTQQINLYQAQFRPQAHLFSPSFMFRAAGIALLAMAVLHGFAWQRVASTEAELQIVALQESAAIERLKNLKPLIAAVTGERSWSEQLDDALQSLQERQAVLSLVQGATIDETQGFSRHLRALARQRVEGIWLTHIVLSAMGDTASLEGRALRAELIPLYVQDLSDHPPFATQRFNNFRIDTPPDDTDQALHFSMDTEDSLTASAVFTQ